MTAPDIDPGAVLTALLDHARKLGAFEVVRLTEFKSAPPNGLCFALWAENLGGVQEGSGLAATNALFACTARMYYPAFGKDEATHEVKMLNAASGYLGRLNGAFTLGGIVRNVDILGEVGDPLRWTFGHVLIDGKVSRVADLAIRAVLNDVWTQGA